MKQPMPIHPALLKLMGLTLRAKVRRATRGLRTRKGIVYSVIACGFLALSIGPAILNAFLRTKAEPSLLRSLAPPALFVFCLTQLMALKPDRGIAFLPAEIDFLFPGPFRRRDLLAYKVLGMMVSSLTVGLFFSVYLAPLTAIWLAGLIGSFLALLFLQLFITCMSLVAARIAQAALTRGRRVVLVCVMAVVAVAGAAALSQARSGDWKAAYTALRESWAARCVLAPFAIFGNTLAAESFAELAGWAAASAAIDVGLVVVALGLDANFMEASLAASQKLYERQQRMRAGSIWTANRSGVARRRLPRFPWWGGAGPIAWRQLTTALHAARGLTIVLVLFCLYAVVPMAFIQGPAQPAIAPSALAFVSCFLLPQMVRFDFRGDLDRMETIKTLPIRPAAVVIGELLTPIAINTGLQVLILGAVAAYQRSLPQGTLPVMLFAVPANLIIYGLENLMFLWYPYRTPVGGIDLSSMGRQMLVMFFKVIALAVVAGFAAGLGGLAYLVSGSIVALLIVAWLATVLAGVGLVPLVAQAYTRFDPSVDTPA